MSKLPAARGAVLTVPPPPCTVGLGSSPQGKPRRSEQVKGKAKGDSEHSSVCHLQPDLGELCRGPGWVDASQSRRRAVSLAVLSSSGCAQHRHGPASWLPGRQGLTPGRVSIWPELA